MKTEKYFTKIVKVGERGQIVIPKNIRKIERIKPEDSLKIIDMNGTIVIKKVNRKSPDEEIFDFLINSGLTMKDWRDIQKERKRER